jgi:altronate hydrolase
MDVDAGRILYGQGTLDDVAEDICGLIGEVAAGRLSVSESLGHREFVLGYKSFEPIGPACHPASLVMAGR